MTDIFDFVLLIVFPGMVFFALGVVVCGMLQPTTIVELGEMICEEQYGEGYEYESYSDDVVRCLPPKDEEKRPFDGGYTAIVQRGVLDG